MLAFVMFDDAYPENILLDWTKQYEFYLNDYFKKKQLADSPIQYDFYPVVIKPPTGVEKPSSDHLYFSSEETQKIFEAGAAKLGKSDFEVMAISPVVLRGFGGDYTFWNNIEIIEAPLIPYLPYSETDKKQGLDSLAAFNQMFQTISQEILHAVGLSGDHMPMGYGTT